MFLTRLARVAGVLGGGCWVVRHLGEVESLYVVGLVLLAAALAGTGAALVSSSASWLRVIVCVAFPLLAWSVTDVLRAAADDSLVDALVGGVVALVYLVTLVRSRGERRHAGSHAA